MKIILFFLTTILILSCRGSDEKSYKFNALFDQQGNPLPDSEVKSDKVNWRKLLWSNPEDRKYSFVGSAGDCTYFAIDTGNTSLNKHYHVAAGHCYSLFPRVQINEGTYRTNSVLYGLYIDNSYITYFNDPFVVYLSTDTHDLAIIESRTSVQELLDNNVKPVKLAQEIPLPGEEVTLVSIPTKGVDRYVLYISTCVVGESVDVYEKDLIFKNAIQHNCPMIIGSSGGVLLNSKGEAFALANTGTPYPLSDSSKCLEKYNFPCEKDEGNLINRPEWNYGMPIIALNNCIENTGVLNVFKEGCDLRTE